VLNIASTTHTDTFVFDADAEAPGTVVADFRQRFDRLDLAGIVGD